jgi:hypothetical protein
MSSTTIDRVAVAEGKAMEGTTLTLPVPTKDRRKAPLSVLWTCMVDVDGRIERGQA